MDVCVPGRWWGSSTPRLQLGRRRNGRNQEAGGEESSRVLAEEPDIPLWSLRFSAGVSLLRAGANRVPRNITSIRFFIDRSIPGFLLPRGVVVRKNVVVVPASAEGRAVRGEVLFLDGAMERTGELKPVILYVHGGAYCCCSSGTHRHFLASLAATTGALIISVEYRRPPEHPFPAAREDVLRAAHRIGGGHFLVEDCHQWGVPGFGSSEPNVQPPTAAEDTTAADMASTAPAFRYLMAGDSAGGGLVVSTMQEIVRLQRRQQQGGTAELAEARASAGDSEQEEQELWWKETEDDVIWSRLDWRDALPCGAVLVSPWVDLSEFSGGTWDTNRAVDFLPADLAEMFAMAYVGRGFNRMQRGSAPRQRPEEETVKPERAPRGRRSASGMHQSSRGIECVEGEAHNASAATTAFGGMQGGKRCGGIAIHDERVAGDDNDDEDGSFRKDSNANRHDNKHSSEESSCGGAVGTREDGEVVTLLRRAGVSPVYGNMRGLPPLCIEAGAREVLVGQIRRLVSKAKRAGVLVLFTEAEDMPHVFPILAPLSSERDGCTPQPLEAFDRMAAFVHRFGSHTDGNDSSRSSDSDSGGDSDGSTGVVRIQPPSGKTERANLRVAGAPSTGGDNAARSVSSTFSSFVSVESVETAAAALRKERQRADTQNRTVSNSSSSSSSCDGDSGGDSGGDGGGSSSCSVGGSSTTDRTNAVASCAAAYTVDMRERFHSVDEFDSRAPTAMTPPLKAQWTDGVLKHSPVSDSNSPERFYSVPSDSDLQQALADSSIAVEEVGPRGTV